MLLSLSYPRTLKVNKAKTQHFSRRRGIFVTGLTIGSDGEVYLGQKRKRTIRALIHQIDGLDQAARHRLAGNLSFAKSIDPDFVNRLVHKYGISKVQRARHPLQS